MDHLVSVIITTYKREPEIIVRAVRSVLSQTYEPLEIIVVDDSPETFPQREQAAVAVQALSAGIRYIKHPRNMGACAARNTGISAARGAFAAFLDDDDEWLPEKLEKQMAVITADTAVGLVYCGAVTVNQVSGETTVQKTQYQSGKLYEKLVYENFIGSTSFPLIRMSCLQAAGGFDPLMQSAQDYDLWTRISQVCDISYVAEPLVRYYIHAGERITTDPRKRIQGQERYIQKNQAYISRNKLVWWRRHTSLAVEYAKDRRLGKALGLWAKTVAAQPGKVKANLRCLARIVHALLRAG